MANTNAPIALVFGASGISGWATVRELLRYPNATTFSRVIGLTNRPVSKEDMLLDDPRLELVSGVDLMLPVETVMKTLQAKVPQISQVTHVYFYAYIHASSPEAAVEVNGQLIDTTLQALKETAPCMAHFIFQTGGKYYGIEYIGQLELPPAPFKESLPRVPEPFASKIFYYNQIDIVAEHARGASWKWNEIRPDCIIGFSPTVNPMNLALALGVYLSLFRAVNGPGSAVPLPSSLVGSQILYNDTLSTHLGRFSIFLSLKDEDALNGQAFNTASGPEPRKRADLWPRLAASFGLKGVPSTQADPNPVLAPQEVGKWVQAHREVWTLLEQKHGLRAGVLDSTGFDFLVVLSIPIDRQYDVTLQNKVGYDVKQDDVAEFEEAWSLFARAKFIPPLGSA